MADLLEFGAERDRRRRPRWVLLAGTVAAVAVAALLAARADPDRREARPAPAPTSPVTPPPLPPAVVSVAVGTRWVYALVTDCTDSAVRSCRYDLHRRPAAGTGGWVRQPLRTGPRVVGISPTVELTADGRVLVLELPVRSRAYVSTDDGVTFAERRLRNGPPVAAAPPTGLVSAGLCLDCGEQLVVLDPTTALLQPLAVQPFADERVRSFAQDGARLWAAQTDEREVTTIAASADGGRTWRRSTVALAAQAQRLYATRDGGAYVVASERGDDGVERLTGLLRADRPGGPWRALPTRGPRSMHTATVDAAGLLLVEQDGGIWRHGATGFTRLSLPAGPPPAWVFAGPARMLVALTHGDRPDGHVLVSTDQGRSWHEERVA